MGKYTQEFTLHYQADPDGVWATLQKAIDNMDGARLGAVHHDGRELEFETGTTLTSWGEFLKAAVEPAAEAGTQVQVRGKPKGTFLTTRLGEKVHAITIEHRLDKGIRAQLG
jgi:hypothetical protein